MREDVGNTNRRFYPRVAWNTAVRFRPHWGGMDWEVSKIKNISLGGCCFESEFPYELGEIVEIEIRSQFLKGTARFVANVKRCQILENPADKRYQLAVQFIEMKEEEKDSFARAIQMQMKMAGHN